MGKEDEVWGRRATCPQPRGGFAELGGRVERRDVGRLGLLWPALTLSADELLRLPVLPALVRLRRPQRRLQLPLHSLYI